MNPAGDNIAEAHVAREKEQARAARRERAMQRYAESQMAAQAELQAAQTPAQAPQDPQSQGLDRFGPVTGENAPGAVESAQTATGLLHTLVPYPTQVAGGALDAIQEAPAALRDAGD